MFYLNCIFQNCKSHFNFQAIEWQADSGTSYLHIVNKNEYHPSFVLGLLICSAELFILHVSILVYNLYLAR